jgi:hypothetical protein
MPDEYGHEWEWAGMEDVCSRCGVTGGTKNNRFNCQATILFPRPKRGQEPTTFGQLAGGHGTPKTS